MVIEASCVGRANAASGNAKYVTNGVNYLAW